MGDILKLSKDKRHRSSSSLAGVILDGTLSERKIDIKASIPEVDDQFAIAEARCEDLQEKIDLVKNLKRKRKLKKRSTTRLADQQISSENMPFISVRTQPKKKVLPQAARLHRLESPINPTRGYLDPTLLEQHRIITKNNENNAEQGIIRRLPRVRTGGRERGDDTCGQGVPIATTTIEPLLKSSCTEDMDSFLGERKKIPKYKRSKPLIEEMHRIKRKFLKQKNVRRTSLNNALNRKVNLEPTQSTPDSSQESISRVSMRAGTSGQPVVSPVSHTKATNRRMQYLLSKNEKAMNLDDSLVELYNKNHDVSHNVRSYAYDQNVFVSPGKINKEEGVNASGDNIGNHSNIASKELATPEAPRLRKTKSMLRRHYALPTLSSRLKQSSSHNLPGKKRLSWFPFIATKSTAPSHNIGANIQQVLNKIKVQQPLTGIPPTLAHHMGISNEDTQGPMCSAHSMPPGEKNKYIKIGQDRLHLPTYKYRSYSRLLKLYREGNTMVRKFLRSFDGANSSYTSMYNMVASRDDDEATSPDGATSKGRGCEQVPKKSLAEYAYLFRVYQTLRKNVNTKRNLKVASVCNKLERQLTVNEEQICKEVQGEQASWSELEQYERHDE